MQFLLKTAEKISLLFAWIGGTLIILSALLVTAEVIMRKLFNISLGGADELSGYAFGIATTLGLSYALFQRAHVRVDALYNLFPRKLKLAADCFGVALLAGFAGVVSVTAWSMVADNISYGSSSITPMRTPLAYPQVPWLIGWLFFCGCAVLVLIAALKAIASGHYDQAERLVSNQSIDEQVEQERAP